MPARIVASPSAASARPVTGSVSVPVICPTDLTCPMFSATSAITAGRNIGNTASVNVGVWNFGSPTQPAAAIAEVSTSPRTSASR